MSLSLVLGLVIAATPALSQHPPGQQGSRNLQIVSHLPLETEGLFSTSDVEIEQELSRPYVYVSHGHRNPGFFVIDITDPGNTTALYRWIIEDAELHQGAGMDNKYFKLGGRYYDVQSFQFRGSGPDTDLGAIVFDVTGLPDTSTITEVGRIRAPDTPGGFHNMFAYKHSDGRVLLFTTTTGANVNVYDMAKFVTGDPLHGLISRIPVPRGEPNRGALDGPRGGYHDFFLGFDPATQRDKFYGAGADGYHVYDVTVPENPRLITSVMGAAGVPNGHTFTPTPDGRYALSMSAPTYQYAPIRIFDLKPGLDGEVKAVTRPVGAWIAQWDGASHNHEVRWPYAFISAQADGLQVINIMDPTNPYTVAYYDTKQGPRLHGEDLGGSIGTGGGIYEGPWGVDIRNADGLIVVSDFNSGFWAFKMEGFDSWNGHQWGMPNVSSVQDWDNGPDGARAAGQVSHR